MFDPIWYGDIYDYPNGCHHLIFYFTIPAHPLHQLYILNSAVLSIYVYRMVSRYKNAHLTLANMLHK